MISSPMINSPMINSRQTYTGYPDLDLAAIRQRLERPLALWYVARTLDPSGSGIVEVADVRNVVRWPRATLARVLRDGDGLFFWHWRGRLYLRSPANVGRWLGVRYVGAMYDAPLSWLAERRLARLRGRLALNAFAVLRQGKPVADATIAAACNVSKRTVLSWKRATKWGRVVNLALLDRIRDEHGPDGCVRNGREGLHLVRHGGTLWLARRLPNSLAGGERKVRKRAALRRVNKGLLTESCDFRGRGEHRYNRFLPDQRRRPCLAVYHFARQVSLWRPVSKSSPVVVGAFAVRTGPGVRPSSGAARLREAQKTAGGFRAGLEPHCYCGGQETQAHERRFWSDD